MQKDVNLFRQQCDFLFDQKTFWPFFLNWFPLVEVNN